MAGFMDNLNKSIATINVKTSKIMESSKYKTAISNKEAEIQALMQNIGETVFLNRANFSINMVSQQIADIEERHASIEELKKQIELLEENEKNILGSSGSTDSPKIFCPMCGAPNEPDSRFCEKCGAKITG